MFSRILYSAIFLIFIFNVQIIFPHNLSKSTFENPDMHHPLILETESSYYNDGINNFNFNTQTNERLLLDTANTDEERTARRLLPQDMSWMEKFLWGTHGIFRSGELTPQKRKSELTLRRTMLTWHQRLGITTWFLMSAAVLAGQLTLNGNRKYRDWHGPLADATIIGYSATALLAILSPPPLIRRSGEHDTVFWHKLLAYVHAAGMILLPILANSIVNRSRFNGVRGPERFNMARARAHQITAYVTYTAFTASIITIFF
ncbi:MAG: hypothetical protein WCE54_22465 [Ignavibacteriaceae bacterium]